MLGRVEVHAWSARRIFCPCAACTVHERASFIRPSSPRPTPVAAHAQSYLVRFNKAATLDGEVNLELPPIQEVVVEVSSLECDVELCL